MKILFMSEEHSIKRKMAAQVAHHFSEGKAEVYQTRTAFDPTDYIMQSVLEEAEIKFTDDGIHVAENLSREVYDVVIMLCKCFRRKMLSFPGYPAVLYWPIENPVRKGSAPHQIQQALKQTRDELIRRMRHLFEDGYMEAF
ncbi:MAG: hypothetical protein HQL32_10480, partial [Planctomycetes bacterium]|nr:hypothetical protein [Planctomycetota bacterium]